MGGVNKLVWKNKTNAPYIIIVLLGKHVGTLVNPSETQRYIGFPEPFNQHMQAEHAVQAPSNTYKRQTSLVTGYKHTKTLHAREHIKTMLHATKYSHSTVRTCCMQKAGTQPQQQQPPHDTDNQSNTHIFGVILLGTVMGQTSKGQQH